MAGAMPLTDTPRHGTTYLRVVRHGDQADGQQGDCSGCGAAHALLRSTDGPG
jgi:hypothetical protein